MILGTALGMFEGKEVDSIDLKNEKNVVSFKLDEETGELYRIEIDEKGNKKKIYNELGELINRGE